MTRAIFNEDMCKGCGLCVAACPKKIVELKEKFNAKGYRPAGIKDAEADKCIGCAFCATMCPDCVITVEK